MSRVHSDFHNFVVKFLIRISNEKETKNELARLFIINLNKLSNTALL